MTITGAEEVSLNRQATEAAEAIAAQNVNAQNAVAQNTGTQNAGTQNAEAKSARRADAGRRRLGRAATLAGAMIITTGVFLVARAAGADFTITDPGQGKVPHTFVPVEIGIVTAVFGLLGWATLAMLERWTRRPRKIWGSLALAAVLLSLVPIWIERATTQTRFSLAVVHVVVYLALLPLLHFGRTGSGAASARR